MARKAVQGYSEKSYFDNTRYLGMIATTDPLQEGFFKHIVNFDISDTGQSVRPRDGFITTPLYGVDYIKLTADKTMMFRSPDDSAFIFYDFGKRIGYVADISSYKINNNLLPITATVGDYDWEQFVQYLATAFPEVYDYYINSNYTLTLNHILDHLNIIYESKVDFIYDENGIRKALVKALLQLPTQANPVTVTIEMYYRGSDSTLIFDCVDNFLHPTFVSSERNLSVSASIIPTNMQILYTANNRPSGHVSNLGNFVYIFDDEDNYVNNFIFRNTNYNIRPYFTLNPAYYDLNNDVNSTDKWAYRVELFNTSSEIGDNKDTVFSTPWMQYNGGVGVTSPVFTVNYDSTISLNNSSRLDNHYKGGKHVIFILPKNLVVSTSSKIFDEATNTYTETFSGKDALGNFVDYASAPFFFTFNTFLNIQNAWLAELNKIEDKVTLVEAITAIKDSAVFYVYDLESTASNGRFSAFDESMQSTSGANTEFFAFKKDEVDEDYTGIFLDHAGLIDYINTNNLFTVNNDIVFKLMPFGANDTRLLATKIISYTSDARFGVQNPFYSVAIPSLSGYSDGTIVQLTGDGKVYQLNTEAPAAWVELAGGANFASIPTRINGAYYRDLRTNSLGQNKFYQWNNNTNASGFMTEVNSLPNTQESEYRWVFAELNYWNEGGLASGASNAYVDYLNVYNNNYRSDFNFLKFDWNTLRYVVESDLNTLKDNTAPLIINSFTSIPQFGPGTTGVEQPPWYLEEAATLPTEAAINTVIHKGTVYKRTLTGWTAISGTALPSAFTQGEYYRDTRTGYLYRWDNPTGRTGRMTYIPEGYVNLARSGFFDKGINGIVYLRPYEAEDITGLTFQKTETLKAVWNATALTQPFNVQYGYDSDSVTYIEKFVTKEPEQILTSNNQLVFENSRLLVWAKNVLYISEEGRYYWFKAKNKIEFGEDIVKVLEYKTIILVFTTQHLYAVYRVETVSTTVNPATNQLEQNVTGVAWLKQAVLYNLLVDKRYADVIQVFNQMILFYSADGQLYMIRPNTTIDDQTRFSMQFFNKAVNDVLENYHEYMNERLAMYGSDTRVTKDQVKIKALVSVNYIKMFYYVPNVMTYIVIYDVISNRYTVYDSLTFTEIYDKLFVESGDLYITRQNDALYFTMHYVEPNVRDNHVDVTFTNNFKKEGINCLIDTGNLNLNNHLNKRFRDLHVVFKNLNSSNLLFNLETHIDDIIAKPFYDTQLEVRDLNGASYFIPVPKLNDNDLVELVDINQISETATDALKYTLTNNLFENNNVLMDFSQFTSSKLLTHRTSILGLGKVFRLKLQFVSKGLYKLQHFGIIYKERRI